MHAFLSTTFFVTLIESEAKDDAHTGAGSHRGLESERSETVEDH